MIKPGTYKATLINHAISETSKGAPQAVIKFSVESDGPKQITWYGSFSEKAQPFTIKALLVCGLKGNNPAGDLEIGKEVSLVIDIETGEDGKERNKVQWINNLGEIKKVIPAEAAKAKLSMLEGAVMLARSKNPVASNEDSDVIPF